MDAEHTLTDEERRAIAALKRLAKHWPPSLMLISYDATLSVIRAADFGALVAEERQDLILADFPDIPSDGGAP